MHNDWSYTILIITSDKLKVAHPNWGKMYKRLTNR